MPIYGKPQMVVLTCFLGNIMGLVSQFKWKTLSHPLLHHVQAYLTALLIGGEPNPCSGTTARSKNAGCCTSGWGWWLLVSSPLNIGSPPGDLQQNCQLDGPLWCWTTMRRHENHGHILSQAISNVFFVVASWIPISDGEIRIFISTITIWPPYFMVSLRPYSVTTTTSGHCPSASLRNASLKFPLESTLVVQNGAAALCVPEAGSIYIHFGYMFIHLYTYIHIYIHISLYILYTIVTKTNAYTCDELVGFYFPIIYIYIYMVYIIYVQYKLSYSYILIQYIVYIWTYYLLLYVIFPIYKYVI